MEPETTISFEIDLTAPTFSIGGVIDGHHYQWPVTPTFTATDAHLSGITATLNGTPFALGDSVSAEGDYTLSAVATDVVGNTTTQAVSFVVDRTAPTIALSGVADGAAYRMPVTPTWTMSDLHTVSDSATLNGAPFTAGTEISAELLWLRRCAFIGGRLHRYVHA